ncbi:MAG: hypothetical protein ACFN0Y_03595 [Lactobacillus sp.]|jgi:NAD-dependent SIR2 family protein deacetylase
MTAWQDFDRVVVAAGRPFAKKEGLVIDPQERDLQAHRTQSLQNYQPGRQMQALQKLLQDKTYFITTTIPLHLFQQAGFNKLRLFDKNGDWTAYKCSSGRHHGVLSYQEAMRHDYHCPVCHSALELNTAWHANFFPDPDQNARLRWFLVEAEDKKTALLFLDDDPQLAPLKSLARQFPNWEAIMAPQDLATFS